MCSDYQAKFRAEHRTMCILSISFRETYFIVALYTIEMFGLRFNLSIEISKRKLLIEPYFCFIHLSVSLFYMKV